LAKVNKVSAETIERLRGVIDFYTLRGVLPVARTWPKKPTPPYTPLQAEAQEVFKIACENLHKISANMLAYWRLSTEGKREQWTDTFKGLYMQYWKKTRGIAPLATDFKITETATQWRVLWYVLQDHFDPTTPDETYTMQTALLNKADFETTPKPIYFTLTDDTGTRLVCPLILFSP
jgi:hypothetical protein